MIGETEIQLFWLSLFFVTIFVIVLFLFIIAASDSMDTRAGYVNCSANHGAPHFYCGGNNCIGNRQNGTGVERQNA